MNLRCRLAFFLALFLLPLGCLLAQQPSVEQRLERLERKVDHLLRLQGVDPDSLFRTVENIHLQFGSPGGTGSVLDKQYFVISHRNDWKIPEWVGYFLSADDLAGDTERTDDFRPDPDLPEGQRAELADYRNSGYDRGHQAPAADFKRNRIAMSTTFLLSNMSPQTPNLNRGMWARLEDEVRSLAAAHGRIWVFTGAVFLDDQGRRTQPADFIGGNRVAVPTHFYKAILCEHPGGTYEMFAFIMPNQRAALGGGTRDYIVTVDRVEELSGLDFFSQLPDAEENRLESIRATNWPIQ